MTVLAILLPVWGCGGRLCQFLIALEAHEDRVRGIEPMFQTFKVPASLLHAKELRGAGGGGGEREREWKERALARERESSRERERDRDTDRENASLGTNR